jgi:hypothetical protein
MASPANEMYRHQTRQLAGLIPRPDNSHWRTVRQHLFDYDTRIGLVARSFFDHSSVAQIGKHLPNGNPAIA